MLEFDYVVNEDIKRAVFKHDIKRRYKLENYTDLNNFCGNAYWELEFCEIYKKK